MEIEEGVRAKEDRDRHSDMSEIQKYKKSMRK